MFRNVEEYSVQNSVFRDAERKYHTNIFNATLIFLVWAASKLGFTNVVNILVFWSALNSWNIYSKLISFRIICFNLNSIKNENVVQHKDHKKNYAEQIPQSKVTSINRVQVNKLLVASQRVVSYKPNCCELGVYHIVSQRVMSLSHCC